MSDNVINVSAFGARNLVQFDEWFEMGFDGANVIDDWEK